MVRVVIYGQNPEEMGQAREGLAEVLRGRQEWPVFREFTGAREPFLQYVRNNPYLVMFVIQRGPEAAETVQLAKEANPAARLVWLCDHDYALYAFGLRLTYFDLLPTCQENLERAVDACGVPRTLPAEKADSSLAQTTPFAQLRIGVGRKEKMPGTGVRQSVYEV